MDCQKLNCHFLRPCGGKRQSGAVIIVIILTVTTVTVTGAMSVSIYERG